MKTKSTPMQFSRLEYKFKVSEHIARLISTELRAHMAPDYFTNSSNKHSYLVSSLYLDSPGLYCYESTSQGEKNRFKLRIRWYGYDLSDPVFLEEKSRQTDAISKLRIQITSDSVRRLLSGGDLSESDLIPHKTMGKAAGILLLEKVRKINARPSCVVRYEREAWEARADNGVRVTFDRALSTSPLDGKSCYDIKEQVNRSTAILEIKFRAYVPEWLAGIVRRYSLNRVSVPKYMLCVDELRAKGLMTLGPNKRLPAGVVSFK